MADSTIAYEAFGNPEHTYYGANSEASVPTFYTGAYQVRQAGVGSVSGRGKGSSVLACMANPPAAMAAADAKAIDSVTYTQNDKYRFFPATT